MRALLLAPLIPEARAFARAFHFPPAARRFPQRFITHGNLAIGLVGAGAPHLQQARTLRPTLLILAGLAGALAPDLTVGDIVIDGDCPPIPATRIGKIATAPAIVASPAQKAALFQKTGALAVDMETDLCRQFACDLHVPFLAVRAISDSADQPLDPALLALLDDDGRVRMSRVLRHLATDPRRMAALIRLGNATRFALSRLSSVLVSILASGWPENPAPRR